MQVRRWHDAVRMQARAGSVTAPSVAVDIPHAARRDAADQGRR
ncbi:hypothetical protein ACTMU2_23000 [Cupriavidus basilensis]